MKVKIIGISKEDYFSTAKGGWFHKLLLGKIGTTGKDFKKSEFVKGFYQGTIHGIVIPEKQYLAKDWCFLAVRVKILEP